MNSRVKPIAIITGGLLVSCMVIMLLAVIVYPLGLLDGQGQVCAALKMRHQISGQFLAHEGSHLIDAFGLVWGLALSLILFTLEFYNTSWYGVTLKRLIRISGIEKAEYAAAIIFYILLCPIVYVTEVSGNYIITVWGICCTYLFFIGIPTSFLAITRRGYVIKILKEASKKLIAKRQEDKGKDMIREIENLPVTDMIRNLNYEDAEEVESLLDVITEIFEGVEKNPQTKSVSYEYLLLLFWAEKITEKSGHDSAYEQKQTAAIMGKVWERLSAKLEGNDCNRKKTGAAIQILIPLLEYNWIFVSVWERLYGYKTRTVLYFYLYEAFKNVYWDEEAGECKNLPRLHHELLKEECTFWDPDLAWRLWISWTIYWNKGNNLGISQFLSFSERIERIAAGNDLML